MSGCRQGKRQKAGDGSFIASSRFQPSPHMKGEIESKMNQIDRNPLQRATRSQKPCETRSKAFAIVQGSFQGAWTQESVAFIISKDLEEIAYCANPWPFPRVSCDKVSGMVQRVLRAYRRTRRRNTPVSGSGRHDADSASAFSHLVSTVRSGWVSRSRESRSWISNAVWIAFVREHTRSLGEEQELEDCDTRSVSSVAYKQLRERTHCARNESGESASG